jgi:DNA polymerase elongation subunit (family B)
MTTLVFDIEVAGFPWDEVDEITRGYLLSRARTPEDRESVSERTALFTGLGKVIAIGMWFVEDDRGSLLLEGKTEAKRDWEKIPGAKIQRGSEKELLETFWQGLDAIRTKERKESRGLRLVTYNGRGYDAPVLMIRSAQLGVRPTMKLLENRYDIGLHCDLMDVLTFHGAWRDHYSLDYWCRRFDIESPKGSIDGSQVSRAYRDGRIEDIGEYCLRDVRATSQLYRKLEPTLLPLFRGG